MSSTMLASGSASGSSPACPDENVLTALAEGVLEGAARLEVDRHLDGCAECHKLVAVLARLAAPPRPAPPRYKIIRQLGEGAMGVVWEAEDTSLNRRVALKFVRPEGADNRALRRRLLREARALAQVRHQNVVSLYDAGEADDEVCLVLELVVGTNARVWRDAVPHTFAEIQDVWRQAAAGVAAVHRAGIVHRDIKPDNVLVADDGRVLVGDFGLATGDLGHTTTNLTISGAMIGTPLYMSPEQLNGDAATAKSDQYALCASFWEAVVGERPFRGTTIGAIVLAMTKPPTIPRVADPERRVLAVLARGLDPDPARRYPDVDALLAALDRPAPTRKRAVMFAIGAACLAAATTVTVLAVTRSGDPTPAILATPIPSTTTPSTTTPSTTTPATPSWTSPSTTTPWTSPPPATPTSPAVAKLVPPPVAARTAPIVTTPIPVLPRPQVTPPPQSQWSQTLTLATDKLQVGDGAGCLKLLATIPPVPADQAEIAELTRMMCMMAAGDCVGGAAAIETYGEAHGWGTDRTKQMIDSSDAVHCPIDAPPKSKWAERAHMRLRLAMSSNSSCKPVLAVMQRRGIQLADPQEQRFLEAHCLANAGDCTGSKAKYRQWMIPANTDPSQLPMMERILDENFPKAFKTCP